MVDDENTLSKFSDIRKIGEGTYGIVFKAKCLKNNSTVALKQIKLNRYV